MSDVRCPVCGRPHLHLTAGPEICTSCLLLAGAPPADASSLPAGQSLLEHLRTLNVIGDGPRGRVFLAEWTTPGGGMVALKCATTKRDAVPVEPGLTTLDHPGIAAIHEVGFNDVVGAYAISDYVPGMPITRYSDRQQLSSSQRVDVWLQSADAIAYAHARGQPHLNLKPTNVLVASGVVQVLDFERALPMAEAPESPYRAPEQADRAPDPRSDVFGLGVLLRELLSGRMDSRLLDDAVARATRADAPRRYQTVAALAADVRACLHALEQRAAR